MRPDGRARSRHVLALNPYFGYGADMRGLLPPTGLEYIAAAMKNLVGKITLLDLACEKAWQAGFRVLLIGGEPLHARTPTAKS